MGLVFVEPRQNGGAYDQEIFLTLKEFGPYLSRTEMSHDFLAPANIIPALQAESEATMDAALQRGLSPGYELGYNFFSINGRMLGEGDPIRVRPGQRVLFHVLNASASEVRSLHLPHHVFRVVALDGNPVPRPAEVPVLWLGPAERISAIVEMKQPGVWAHGRCQRMKIATAAWACGREYAGSRGTPQWVKPPMFHWDYRRLRYPARPRLARMKFSISNSPPKLVRLAEFRPFRDQWRALFHAKDGADVPLAQRPPLPIAHGERDR